MELIIKMRMKKILLWVWCFPQNLLGLFVKIITKAKKTGDHYVYKIKSGSVSLGEFVFLTEERANDHFMLSHEMGHRAQSRRLGLLYLLVIGIPSAAWCVFFRRYRERRGVGYYDFYTEKWANKLGGVK